MKILSSDTREAILTEYKKALGKGYTAKGNLSRDPEVRAKQKSAINYVGKKLGFHNSTVLTAIQTLPSVETPVTKTQSPEEFHDEIKRMLQGLSEPPTGPIKTIPYKETVDELLPVFLFSDWHIGETVDPSQVFGFNSFNAKIAESRVNDLISKALALSTKYSKAEKAVIWLGGDFVSGWLHEELVATDYATPLESVHWACTKLYHLIQKFSEVFPSIEILCSPGNHGRLFKRPSAKISTTTSFDWLIYAQMKNWLEKNSKVSFTIPIEGDCWVEIAGHRFLFTHGHQLGVNGGDGMIGALGPILRGAIKTSRSLHSVGRGYTYLVIGHYHQSIWQPGQGVICNGALVGFNEFAKLMRFRAERPSQTLFFVHKEYGPVIPIDLYL